MPNHKKLLELALYISEKANSDEYLSATKLNKILFLTDFHYYLKTGKSITGQEYLKFPYGPVPKDMKRIEKDNKADIVFKVSDFFGKSQKKPIALRQPQLKGFSAEEISFVDSLIEVVCGKSKTSATFISDKSHEYLGWQMVPMGKPIPYNTIYFGKSRDQKVSSFVKLHAERLLTELGTDYGYQQVA